MHKAARASGQVFGFGVSGSSPSSSYIPILRSMSAQRLLIGLAGLLMLTLSTSAVEIISIDWNTDLGVMVVELGSFPAWGEW